MSTKAEPTCPDALLYPPPFTTFPYLSPPASEWSLSGETSFSDASPLNSPPITHYPNRDGAANIPATGDVAGAPHVSFDFTLSHTLRNRYPFPTSGFPLLSAPSIPRISSYLRPVRPKSKRPDKKDHVGRPMNAFMLFRSAMVNSGTIPPTVERRQQNLSQIAGERWRGLPEAEKVYWYDRAKEAAAQHQANHPTYKYEPISKKRKAERLTAAHAKRYKDMEPRGNITMGSGSQPTYHPALPLLVPACASSLEESAVEPLLPPFFPMDSLPHTVPHRQSITPPGFKSRDTGDSSGLGLTLKYPSSSESATIGLEQDANVTPTAAKFRKSAHAFAENSVEEPFPSSALQIASPLLGISDPWVAFNAWTREHDFPFSSELLRSCEPNQKALEESITFTDSLYSDLYDPSAPLFPELSPASTSSTAELPSQAEIESLIDWNAYL